MKLNNEQGVALIMSLLTMVILLGFSAVFILRTIHESHMAKKDLAMAQSFYIAEGGTYAAIDELDNLVNNFMTTTINNTNPSTVISNTQSFVSSNDGVGFIISTVLNGGSPVLTQVGNAAEFTATENLGNGSYDFIITISEKTDPIAVTVDSWDFAYTYQMIVKGKADNLDKDVVLTGDFTVRVQRDNFAKYALFTNSQTLPNGTKVWFTNKTNFAGPMHTNGRFNFAFNPSGIFEDVVSQVNAFARYYNNGYTVLLDADANGNKDVPTFNNGFNRGVSAISLSSGTNQADIVDQSLGGATVSGNGIYIPNASGALTGGIYVRGNGNIDLSVNGSNQAVYTVSQGSTTKTITVDDVTNTTTVSDGSTTTVYAGQPKGVDGVGTVIYVEGRIQSLGGTVQSNTALTISSSDDITINDHVRYQAYTPAVGSPGDAGYVPPYATGMDNILGLVSWDGDVRIGTSAPDNIDVHATVLARDGIVQVDDYNDTGEGGRGTATLLGGIITDNYGAFGMASGSTGNQLSGYGRNFVYDERMETGSAPPYFPSLNTFIAFTNDITDKMIWQEGEL